MTYVEDWGHHVLPRCRAYATERAIEVTYGTVYQADGWTLGPLRDVSFSEALDASMAYALRWGAHRLPDRAFRDLEEHISSLILEIITKLETPHAP